MFSPTINGNTSLSKKVVFEIYDSSGFTNYHSFNLPQTAIFLGFFLWEKVCIKFINQQEVKKYYENSVDCGG